MRNRNRGWDGTLHVLVLLRELGLDPASAAAEVGAYFEQDFQGLIERLLSEQVADGGWNCEVPHRSTRASFNTTIGVLEALRADERSTRAAVEVVGRAPACASQAVGGPTEMRPSAETWGEHELDSHV